MKQTNDLKILIIDTDEVLTMALKYEIEKAFDAHTVSVLTFTRATSCEVLVKQDPDIVIMDYRLDSTDYEGSVTGLTTLDKLKIKRPLTQVILLTSEESAEVAVTALHHGVHDYIIKNEHMFKKLRLSLLQCFSIVELRQNMKKQVNLGIFSLVVIFLMFGVVLGLSAAYAPSAEQPVNETAAKQAPAAELKMVSVHPSPLKVRGSVN